MEQARIKEHITIEKSDTASPSREALCLHCGSSIDSHKTPTEGSSGARFCCSGCRAVYELLHSKGLASFYSLADRLGSPRPSLTAPIADESIPIPEHAGDTVTFQLGGIQCASCVWLLERLPILRNGVIYARVRLSHGDITVRYDRELVTPLEIARTITTLGYSLHSQHQESHPSQERDRESLIQIAIAGACAMNIMVLAVSLYQGIFTGIDAHYEALFRWISLALSIPVVGYCAIPIYRRGLGALRAGTLHIDLPITIGIILSFLLGALNTVLGSGEIYFDSVATIVFLLLSTRFMQHRAFERARNTCASRWSLLPHTVRKVDPDDSEREIPLKHLQPGIVLRVKAGERIPCDGVVRSGTSSLDYSTITGEALPIPVNPGDAILAGSLNLESPITVSSTHGAGASRLDKIIASVSASISAPPQFSTTLDTFSLLFTASALLLAGGAFLFSLSEGLQVAASAAIAMLTVTCPCAVALALPLLTIRALSHAAEMGILVASPHVFESLPKISKIFLDKTGTLTTGQLRIARYTLSEDLPREEAEELLSDLTTIDPRHPVSQALSRWISPSAHRDSESSERKRIPGCGVSMLARVRDHLVPHRVVLASLSYVQSLNLVPCLQRYESDPSSSVVVLVVTPTSYAIFDLADAARPGIATTIEQLSRHSEITILSGDRPETTRKIAADLSIPTSRAFGGLLPEKKAVIISESKTPTMFAGDGANDAPALQAATVGVALRGGIQSILESADVFIERGGIEQLSRLRRIAVRNHVMARSLVGIGLLYNAVGIGAAFLGYVSPLVAAVAMPIFSSILLTLAYLSFIGIASPKDS